MAYKSKLRADIHSLDEAGTNRDHTIFHNYYSELLYSKKVSWFSQMKLFLYPISYKLYNKCTLQDISILIAVF